MRAARPTAEKKKAPKETSPQNSEENNSISASTEFGHEDRPFPPPSRPPSHLRQTQEQEQGRQPHALRLQPPLRPELPGGGAARGRRTRAAAGGLCASHPQARRCRRAAARVPALAPASLPREETKGRFSRVTARPLTGKQSRPRRGRPPHKGAPRLGRGVGALVPAPRAGSHPPAGVCASVHRNAVGGGGLREPGSPGWTGRAGGARGREESGQRAGHRRCGTRHPRYGPRKCTAPLPTTRPGPAIPDAPRSSVHLH
nr:translation initiation factor IF-2-like [Pongo abelii]